MAKSSKEISIMDDSSIIGYDTVLSDVIDLLESARRASARTINTIMTATYWEIGRRIVDFEQGGEKRAEYGKELLQQLSVDLTSKFGRGFSVDNLETMRLFYQTYMMLKVSLRNPRRCLGNSIRLISYSRFHGHIM